MAGFKRSWEFAADLPPDVQSVELTDVNDIMSGNGQFSGSGVDIRLSDFCFSTSEPAVFRHDVSSTSFVLCRAR